MPPCHHSIPRTSHSVRCRLLQGSARRPRCQATPTVQPEDPVSTGKVSWDPKNLLNEASATDRERIKKRLAERRSAQAATPASFAPPVQSLPKEAAGGQPLAQVPHLTGGAPIEQHLAEIFMPVNTSDERIRVHCMDPPILTVEDFVDSETCEAMIAAAKASGKLQRSKTGASNVSTGLNSYSSRRTSSTLLVNQDIQLANPELKSLSKGLQDDIQSLLPGQSWGTPGRRPSPGAYTFEALQMAVYAKGEHFLEHEDAFPVRSALENRFQRRATVLIYLNDVANGGQTRFPLLNVAIRPKRGRALLFFPSFSNGKPDERTAHASEDAVDEKWVAQQWCACGVAMPVGADAQRALEAMGKMDGGAGPGGKGGLQLPALSPKVAFGKQGKRGRSASVAVGEKAQGESLDFIAARRGKSKGKGKGAASGGARKGFGK